MSLKARRSFCVVFLLSVTIVRAGPLVGIGADAGHNQFLSIDAESGAATVLNTFDFSSGGWRSTTFTVDPAAGMAYALSDDALLYRFDLVTGAIIGVPTATADLQAVAPGNTGLVAICYNASISQNQFLAVDPVSGTVSTLNSFNFSSGAWRPESLTVDSAAGIAYAVSSDDHLYRFDIATGAILGSPSPTAFVQAMNLGSAGLVSIGLNLATGHNQFMAIDPATRPEQHSFWLPCRFAPADTDAGRSWP
jgi:hypothetical protein